MKIDEAIKQCNDLINDFKNNEEERVNATDILAIETVLKTLEHSSGIDKIQEEKREMFGC